MNSVFVEGWRPMGKIYLTLAAIFVAVVHAPAQAPVPARADLERRVDSILSLMTIEEKIDRFGGVNFYNVRAIPRLGLPYWKERRNSEGELRRLHKI